ncbi:MAG: glycine zipper domain-containing protein [Pseudomonadota bacterium]
MKKLICTAIMMLSSSISYAGDLTTDAAIGGAIGGAVGGAVGAEVGGREGAIIGAGVGGAAGAAINTKDHQQNDTHSERYEKVNIYEERRHNGGFCPPGQAKKGRC